MCIIIIANDTDSQSYSFCCIFSSFHLESSHLLLSSLICDYCSSSMVIAQIVPFLQYHSTPLLMPHSHLQLSDRLDYKKHRILTKKYISYSIDIFESSIPLSVTSSGTVDDTTPVFTVVESLLPSESVTIDAFVSIGFIKPFSIECNSFSSVCIRSRIC